VSSFYLPVAILVDSEGAIDPTFIHSLQVPEYTWGGLAALGSCFVGLIVFKKRSSLPHFCFK